MVLEYLYNYENYHVICWLFFQSYYTPIAATANTLDISDASFIIVIHSVLYCPLYRGSIGFISSGHNGQLFDGQTGYPYPRSTNCFLYPLHLGSSHLSIISYSTSICLIDNSILGRNSIYNYRIILNNNIYIL